VAYNYLCKNIVLNQVTSIVKPVLGDNRKNAPRDAADRVLMGYLGDTQRFLSVAIECLINKVGVIHFHDVFQNEDIPQKPVDIIRNHVMQYDRDVKLLMYQKIKSYAPGLSHTVFDVQVVE
jgi:tRNA wybutosine-synthesizing protein 2